MPPEKQIIPLGSAAAPASWTLPPAFSIVPEVVYAMYDGSGAAGAYIPTLEIISDSGHVIGKIPMDNSVAAGSSVEATWAPFLRSGGGAAAASTGLKWAQTNGHVAAYNNVPNPNNLDTIDLGAVSTNDSTLFTQGNVAGKHGISINSEGTYLVVTTNSYDASIAPAAGSFVQAYNSVGATGPVNFAYYGSWNSFGGGDWQAGATMATMTVISSPGNPPPKVVINQASQNSGNAVDLVSYQTVIQIATTTTT
jgi:hypothetical protein